MAQRGCILASRPTAQVQFLAFPKVYFNASETLRLYWLVENGQRLENVVQNHLELVSSGKLVQQKLLC